MSLWAQYYASFVSELSAEGILYSPAYQSCLGLDHENRCHQSPKMTDPSPATEVNRPNKNLRVISRVVLFLSEL
jgi:hypothetical protein